MLRDLLPELDRFRLVLASGSPRRHELLAQIGVWAEIIPSLFVEDLDKLIFTSPSEYCLENSRRKALAVLDKIKDTSKGPLIIIGSDTIVVKDDKILEKPKTPEDALEMLSSLQGNTHAVLSSIAILVMEEKMQRPKIVADFEKTFVTFDAVSTEALKAYIKTNDPMDKAGSYGIQGPFAVFIKSIQGDYYNVVGFPLNLFYRLIQIAINSSQQL